jgi:glutamyl/glutaminyl-tRNA synthetase
MGVKRSDDARINWRFRVPEGETVSFVDGNLGAQHFVAGKDFGDFVVWRQADVPSYQLACTVDDAATQITEAVRGADLLPSTARQLRLYRSPSIPSVAYYLAGRGSGRMPTVGSAAFGSLPR